MFYKVLKDNRVVDVLDKLVYLKWQDKHQIMVLCDVNEAQAILGSDGNTVWHESSLYRVPVEGYDTVTLEVIDKYEYNQLKLFSLKSVESLIDEYTLLLLSEGVI